MTGDWDANASDTIGVKQTQGPTWQIRNTNTAGPADQTFDYGIANNFPLTWQKP